MDFWIERYSGFYALSPNDRSFEAIYFVVLWISIYNVFSIVEDHRHGRPTFSFCPVVRVPWPNWDFVVQSQPEHRRHSRLRHCIQHSKQCPRQKWIGHEPEIVRRNASWPFDSMHPSAIEQLIFSQQQIALKAIFRTSLGKQILGTSQIVFNLVV